MKPTTKQLKTAKEWIYFALMYAAFDCCDSMHEAEKLENRFNALVDDKIEIADFVKEFLYKDYIKGLKDVYKEAGTDESLDVFYTERAASELPIPYHEIKNDLI